MTEFKAKVGGELYCGLTRFKCADFTPLFPSLMGVAWYERTAFSQFLRGDYAGVWRNHLSAIGYGFLSGRLVGFPKGLLQKHRVAGVDFFNQGRSEFDSNYSDLDLKFYFVLWLKVVLGVLLRK